MRWYFAIPLGISIVLSLLVWVLILITDIERVRLFGVFPWIKLIFLGNGIHANRCHSPNCTGLADPRCRGSLCAHHCHTHCKGECIQNDKEMIKKMIAKAPIMTELVLPRPIGRKVQM